MKQIATFVSGLMVGVLLFGGSFAWGGFMAEESHTPFYLNDQPVEIKAYLINGNNYFKLRDIAALMDFGVTWDQSTRSVYIDTIASYTPEKQEQTVGTELVDYSAEANSAVFTETYTREIYNLFRDCILTGNSREFQNEHTKEQIIWAVENTAIEWPTYDFRRGEDGIDTLYTKYPVLMAEGVRDCAQFLERVKNYSTYDKIYAAAVEVCKQLDYKVDATTTPADLFKPGLHYGNCMSFAHGFKFLCDLMDIPSILVHNEIHQWNEVYYEGQWYFLDLTSFNHFVDDVDDGEGTDFPLLEEMELYEAHRITRTDTDRALFAKELLVPGSTLTTR